MPAHDARRRDPANSQSQRDLSAGHNRIGDVSLSSSCGYRPPVTSTTLPVV